jgi:predicted DsbA family dithiol-disulfide isomerase
MAMMNVEIWSDVACPWCAIGKRRFEAALEGFEHRDEVRVTWRSFELDPDAPAERTGDRVDALAKKYGISREQAQAAQDHITREAAGEGLDFRFDVARSGNMFDAHRLLQLAARHGAQAALADRLFRAYLSEGALVSDHDVLVRCAVDAGIPEDDARETLASDRFAAEVRADEELASRLGISAVPFFVVDRAIGASGAQPPEILRELLRRGWEQRAPVEVVAGGEACGPDGC